MLALAARRGQGAGGRAEPGAADVDAAERARAPRRREPRARARHRRGRRRRRPGRRAGPAQPGRAPRRGVRRGAAAAAGAAAGGAPDDPQPGHDGRQPGARRPGRRDAGGAVPARRDRHAARTRRAPGTWRRRTSSSARWSPRCGPASWPCTRPSGGRRRAAARAFVEVSRRQGDYAMCGVGAVVRRDGTARVALVSVGAGPVLVELERPGRRRRGARVSWTPRSTRRTTSTPARTTAGTSRTSSSVAPSTEAGERVA